MPINAIRSHNPPLFQIAPKQGEGGLWRTVALGLFFIGTPVPATCSAVKRSARFGANPLRCCSVVRETQWLTGGRLTKYWFQFIVEVVQKVNLKRAKQARNYPKIPKNHQNVDNLYKKST